MAYRFLEVGKQARVQAEGLAPITFFLIALAWASRQLRPKVSTFLAF